MFERLFAIRPSQSQSRDRPGNATADAAPGEERSNHLAQRVPVECTSLHVRVPQLPQPYPCFTLPPIFCVYDLSTISQRKLAVALLKLPFAFSLCFRSGSTPLSTFFWPINLQAHFLLPAADLPILDWPILDWLAMTLYEVAVPGRTLNAFSSLFLSSVC